MRDIITTSKTNDYTDFSDLFHDVTRHDILLMKARCRRNAALTLLVGLIEKYSDEIKAERSRANPDFRYIAAREKKISEMRQTLKSAQR